MRLGGKAALGISNQPHDAELTHARHPFARHCAPAARRARARAHLWFLSLRAVSQKCAAGGSGACSRGRRNPVRGARARWRAVGPVEDVLPLDLGEAIRAAGSRDVQRHFHLEHRTGRQDEGALDDILQLAHVARPGVVDEPVHDGPGHSCDVAAEPRLEALDHRPDQERDVLPPLTQRRQPDGEDAEPVALATVGSMVVRNRCPGCEGERIRRLEGAIDEALAAAPPTLQTPIAALQALRGIAKISAATHRHRGGSPVPRRLPASAHEL
jgi:hypothetical protein